MGPNIRQELGTARLADLLREAARRAPSRRATPRRPAPKLPSEAR
jgi:hypothetical protein